MVVGQKLFVVTDFFDVFSVIAKSVTLITNDEDEGNVVCVTTSLNSQNPTNHEIFHYEEYCKKIYLREGAPTHNKTIFVEYHDAVEYARKGLKDVIVQKTRELESLNAKYTKMDDLILF
jgi:hypothetical protein